MGGGEGGRGGQVSGARITHCHEGLDLALSRMGARSWDGASEARLGAKEALVSPVPSWAVFYCAGLRQVASSFWVSVFSPVTWTPGSYEGGHQTDHSVRPLGCWWSGESVCQLAGQSGRISYILRMFLTFTSAAPFLRTYPEIIIWDL